MGVSPGTSVKVQARFNQSPHAYTILTSKLKGLQNLSSKGYGLQCLSKNGEDTTKGLKVINYMVWLFQVQIYCQLLITHALASNAISVVQLKICQLVPLQGSICRHEISLSTCKA